MKTFHLNTHRLISSSASPPSAVETNDAPTDPGFSRLPTKLRNRSGVLTLGPWEATVESKAMEVEPDDLWVDFEETIPNIYLLLADNE